jgi:hypothetical protein
MLSGSLSYGSYIQGVEFENIEVPSIGSSVQKIEVASDKDGNVSIRVYVERVTDQAEAEAIGLREATRVVNILSVEQGQHVTDPTYKGHALKDDLTDVHKIGDSIGLFVAAHCVKKLEGQSLTTLKSALSEPVPPGEADYQLFRSSLNTKDIASKFLSLYRLLGRLADPTGRDRQGMIDTLIERHEPGVTKSTSPQTGQPETVYTKLRNEHMHRSSVPLAQVRADMETHLPGLISLVRQAIKTP